MPSRPPPAHHLGFLLEMNRAHASAARRFDAAIGAVHGIGLNDFHLLQALSAAPGRRLRRTDLAHALGVTVSGVTWMLRPLTKRRLVTHAASEEDGRVTYAVLTEAGHRLVEDALPTARHIATDLLDGRIEGDELSRVAAIVARLTPSPEEKKRP